MRTGRSWEILLRQQDADELAAVVRVRSVEESAGAQAQVPRQPDVVDVVDGEPGGERPAPAGGRPAGQAIVERLQLRKTQAPARRVEVAEDQVVRLPGCIGLPAGVCDRVQEGESRS